MINLKIYKYKLVNLNKVNMTNNNNETVKNSQTPFENFTDKNGNLKRYLNLALKNTREIMKVLLPKIAVEIQKMIEFHLSSTKDQLKTEKTKSVIKEKAIREHIYNFGFISLNIAFCFFNMKLNHFLNFNSNFRQ